MVDFANCSLVTPEGVVILGIFCVRVPGRGEDLVPQSGIAVGFRNTMWWLNCDWEHVAGCCHSHAGAEHDLLAVAVQDTLIRVPGCWQGEGDVYLLVGFSA